MAGQDLYPTQYILFVAPSGTGKTQSSSIASRLLSEVDGLCRAPTSLSRASLIDSLVNANRSTFYGLGDGSMQEQFAYNSIHVVANELGVLLPVYDHDVMATFTDIYDGEPYEEKKRSKDIHNTIAKPQINLLAGATPSYLQSLMPEGAWDQGFISRVIMVWASHSEKQDPFNEYALPEELRKKLVTDLRSMVELIGPMTITPEAQAAFSGWYMNGQAPAPTHPKLVNYLTRRGTHLMKLCIIMSISRSFSKEITLGDYHDALNALCECEHEMEQIFPAMASGGEAKVIDDVWHQLMQMHLRSKKSIPQSMLYNLLSARLPSHAVNVTIEIMVKRKLLQPVIENAQEPHFIPLGPDRHDL